MTRKVTTALVVVIVVLVVLLLVCMFSPGHARELEELRWQVAEQAKRRDREERQRAVLKTQVKQAEEKKDLSVAEARRLQKAMAQQREMLKKEEAKAVAHQEEMRTVEAAAMVHGATLVEELERGGLNETRREAVIRELNELGEAIHAGRAIHYATREDLDQAHAIVGHAAQQAALVLSGGRDVRRRRNGEGRSKT